MGRTTTAMSNFVDIKSNFNGNFKSGTFKNRIALLAVLGFFLCAISIQAQNTYTYQIIDAANNTVAVSSFGGDYTWNLATASSINIVSNTNQGTYAKVRFITVENTRTESGHPYAYYGDLAGDYGLQDGTYYGWSPTVGTLAFTVKYFLTNSDANNNNAAVTDTFTMTFVNNPVDTTAPSIPSNVVAANVTATSVDLSWSGSTDADSGIKEYVVYMQTGGSGSYVQQAVATTTSTTISGLTPSTAYNFEVSAVDNATPGNESDPSLVPTSITTLSNGNGGSNPPGLELYDELSAVTSISQNESSSLGSWTVTNSNGVQLSVDGTNPYSGNQSLRLEQLAANWSHAKYTFPIVSGKDYIISIHARSNSATKSGFYQWEGFAGFNNVPGRDIENSNWTEYTFNLTADSDQGVIKLYTGNAPAIGDVVYIDNVSIIEVGTAPPSGGDGGYWTQTGSDIYYDTGNVGIGTTNIGTWQLAVGGRIRAEEIKVETGWADYVFFNDYRLPTLEEVEQHIEDKGHLINIPSASEVKANGIELGDMNKLLLEKIEELMLYIIQQEKRIKTLETNECK